MYISHLYYVHLQFEFSSRFFFYETGTSISILILSELCKLFQYISELEFVMANIKDDTNEWNDPNCIISFNLHDDTGNKALLALLFLPYGWRPWGMGMLNDTWYHNIFPCDIPRYDCYVSLSPSISFQSPSPRLLPMFTKLYYTLVSASTYSKILTLYCFLPGFFKHKLPTNMVFYIEIKSWIFKIRIVEHYHSFLVICLSLACPCNFVGLMQSSSMLTISSSSVILLNLKLWVSKDLKEWDAEIFQETVR